ncbi:thiamine-phosphate kinase [Jatrophihabitans endophyticus]|uniref:Thiamine-monophosphate kinase n=1 Tax=Jatrophihabitans endophyticus TaxID=1206085 RepID=A0A1M5D2L4_9ACTN|nr:thiamine-phosphate kinase [Jatrophihabitans endophyticus]SHF61211.1 thiamine-phosphate kinase [Jatrophihabitans endophyticus]
MAPETGTVAEAGEFGVISRVVAGLATVPSTVVGPGDDAAVVATPDGRVVASTDMLVENRHFRRDWSTAEDVGHKAAARAFSDISAMGAVPTALLVAFAAPGTLGLDWVDGVTTGLRAECAHVEAAIVGGDVTAADVVTLGLTALGDLQGRAPVTLAGARVGDVVAVCGRLGWAAAGFAVLGRGFRSPVTVVNAHRRPEPPYFEGPRAAELGATAMTDVSDGLVADLGHVATASGVRLDLRAELIDVPAKLAEVGAALNVDPLVWVLTGGDDYALAATFPAGTDLPAPWRPVGVVSEGEGVRVDGRRWPVGGHEHFR